MAKNHYISEFGIESEEFNNLTKVSKLLGFTKVQVIRFILKKVLKNMISQLERNEQSIFFPEIKTRVET